MVKELTTNAPNAGGFYLWGSYSKRGLWKNIYIGKSAHNNTNGLRGRISESLKDGRHFLWKTKLTEKGLLERLKINYPTKYLDYMKAWNYTMHKFNSTHIIWVEIQSEIPNNEILTIESDLIETMNPTANIKRPKPDGVLQANTINVIREFKKHIHLSRSNNLFIPKAA